MENSRDKGKAPKGKAPKQQQENECWGKCGKKMGVGWCVCKDCRDKFSCTRYGLNNRPQMAKIGLSTLVLSEEQMAKAIHLQAIEEKCQKDKTKK